MAKKEKRPKKGGSSSGARNQNETKAPKRAQTKKPSSSNAVIIIVICVLVVLAALGFASISRTPIDNHNSDGSNHSAGHHVPIIDGEEIEPDPERDEKTQDFLNNFVCNYHPGTSAEGGVIAKTVDIDGYCHPNLIADPLHRTQRVSSSSSNNAGGGDNGIPKGELVMRLPRPLQIWDLDALRDRFIQQEFLGLRSGRNEKESKEDITHETLVAVHKTTENPLDSGAYLAVYLIRLMHGSQAGKSSSEKYNAGQCTNNEDGECHLNLKWHDLDQQSERAESLSAYLDMLPTVKDRSSNSNTNPYGHPLFWSASLLQALLPKNTHTYDLIRHYQQMIESEYEALTHMSKEFRQNVKYMEYLNMRINVLSRAFGVPATTDDSGLFWGTTYNGMEQSITEKIKMYETSNFGSHLANTEDLDTDDLGLLKLRGMCPLLDMYNSHPNPNVSWRYNSKTSSYDILSTHESNIPPGHSIVVSYGKYTEGHLFAKYGYVNGDGSSPTEVSLAVFHRMMVDVGLGQQYSPLPFNISENMYQNMIDGLRNVDPEKEDGLPLANKALELQAKELIRYLIFDDGYEDCIDLTESSGSSDEVLKLLKLKHLIQIANYREAWIVRLPPKDPKARPIQHDGSTMPSTKQQKGPVGINAHRIISICRLLSMRTDDIDGGAIEYLRKGLSQYETQANDIFLVEKHEDSLEYRAMMCAVRLCNVALARYIGFEKEGPTKVGSIAWNAWYVREGEIRALGSLLQTAASEANKLKQMHQSGDASMTVREEGACPLNYTTPLLDML